MQEQNTFYYNRFVGLRGVMGTLKCNGHAEVRWSTPKCDGRFAEVRWFSNTTLLQNL